MSPTQIAPSTETGGSFGRRGIERWPMTTFRNYTVLEDSNLDKICQEVFGSRSSAGVNAILRANPEWSGNVRISSGTILRIPPQIDLDVFEDPPVEERARRVLG